MGTKTPARRKKRDSCKLSVNGLPAWADAYFAALAVCGVSCHAAEQAGIHFTTVTPHLAKPAFRERYEAAKAQFAARLERKAHERALGTTRELVLHQGRPVFVAYDADGNVVADGTPGATLRPLYRDCQSDTMLIFSLKGELPEKYMERRQLTGDAARPVVVRFTNDSGQTLDV